jgi:hypothetical protein
MGSDTVRLESATGEGENRDISFRIDQCKPLVPDIGCFRTSSGAGERDGQVQARGGALVDVIGRVRETDRAPTLFLRLVEPTVVGEEAALEKVQVDEIRDVVKRRDLPRDKRSYAESRRA